MLLLAPTHACTQLSRVLSRVDDWQFDSFALERASNGRPLSVLAFFLFSRARITKRFGIDPRKLARWVRLGYAM